MQVKAIRYGDMNETQSAVTRANAKYCQQAHSKQIYRNIGRYRRGYANDMVKA